MTGHGAPSALRSATASARLLGTEISRRLRPFLAARRGLDSIMPTSGGKVVSPPGWVDQTASTFSAAELSCS